MVFAGSTLVEIPGLRLWVLYDDNLRALDHNLGHEESQLVIWEDGSFTPIAADPSLAGSDVFISPTLSLRDAAGNYVPLTYERQAAYVDGEDLHIVGEDHSEALGVNVHGDVVGHRWVDDIRDAVLWRNGGMTVLSSDGKNSSALDINDHGVVAGAEQVDVDENLWKAFKWENGTKTVLDTPPIPNVEVIINTRGDVLVTPWVKSSDGVDHPVHLVHADGTSVEVPLWRAVGLSDDGWVLGEVREDGERRFVIWHADKGTRDLTDLVSLVDEQRFDEVVWMTPSGGILLWGTDKEGGLASFIVRPPATGWY